MFEKTYYIPGRGRNYMDGMGKSISALSSELNGINYADWQHNKSRKAWDILEDYFVDEIATNLSTTSYDLVVANSYGSYLLILTLIKHELHLENAIIFSPILGRIMDEKLGFYSRPPYSKSVKQAIEQAKLSVPENFTLVLGQHEPKNTLDTAKLLQKSPINANVNILPDCGHRLPHETVRHWLQRVSTKTR